MYGHVVSCVCRRNDLFFFAQAARLDCAISCTCHLLFQFHRGSGDLSLHCHAFCGLSNDGRLVLLYSFVISRVAFAASASFGFLSIRLLLSTVPLIVYSSDLLVKHFPSFFYRVPCIIFFFFYIYIISSTHTYICVS